MNTSRASRLGVAAVAAAAVGLAFLPGTAAPAKITPKAGAWRATVAGGRSGSGAAGQFTVAGISFRVSANHRSVSGFGFSYSYSGPIKPPSGTCSGSGFSAAAKSSAIKSGKFSTPAITPWTGAGNGSFQGVFDSARRAHGTARLSLYIGAPGCQFSGTVYTGTVTWHATR